MRASLRPAWVGALFLVCFIIAVQHALRDAAMAAPFPHHLDAYLGKTERQKLRSTLVKLNPLPAGKDLFAQGQQTTNFFIIAKGTADVYVHGVRVRTLVALSLIHI